MKQSKNNSEIENLSKERTKQQMSDRLKTAFASFLPILGEKKFNKRVKKATKVLLRNLNGTTKYISNKPLKDKDLKKKTKTEQ